MIRYRILLRGHETSPASEGALLCPDDDRARASAASLLAARPDYASITLYDGDRLVAELDRGETETLTERLG